MRKFIHFIIIFLIPILIGMISLELLLRKIPNDYSYKKSFLDSNSNNIKVLFLGNSHIYFGINPIFMKYNSFNGSHISQSLNLDLAIIEKYKDRLKNLSYIIVPVDYFSLYSSLEDDIERWRVKNYSIYYNIFLNKNYIDNFEITNGRFYNNILRAKMYLLYNKADVTCNRLGFGTTYNSENSMDLLETGKNAAKRHKKNISNNISFAKNIHAIQSIISFSEIKNIKVIFVTCPCYYTYRDNLEKNQLNNTINNIKDMCSNKQNAFYVNLMYDTSFYGMDYYDADHLNEIGAKKFTLKLEALIDSIENNNTVRLY